jgi:hypothetical protein
MPVPADRGHRDELAQLPAALADAVRACARASGLGGDARVSLIRELSAHMLDAIGAGKSEQQILDEFGDAALAGGMIRHVRSRLPSWPRRLAIAAGALGAAALFTLYVGSAVTLHAHSPVVRSTLADADRVRLLAASPLDLAEATRVVDALLGQMYSEGGILTADGLRIVQRLKGVDRPARTALVAEPAYFVLPASRREVEREWRRIAEVIRAARVGGPNSREWRALEAEADRFSWARRDGFRYAPLAIVLPRLVVALRSESGAR